METPLPIERKILSNYGDVSRTFTYGMLATLPLFVIYNIGIFFLNTAEKPSTINGAQKILEQISTLWGALPETTSGLLLVISMMAMLYWERKKYGFLRIRPFFFFFTLNESLFYGLTLGGIAYGLTQLTFLLFPHTREFVIIVKAPLSIFNGVHALGAGFYEEMLFRVVLLGGGLAIWGFLKIPGVLARVIWITITSMLFSGIHYTGHLGEPFTLNSFLYRSYMGVLLSTIYLWRGFGTVAWSHALFDIIVHL